MTGFDAFAIVVILASVAAGWVRGGMRETVSLLAFALSAILALISLPLTSRVGRAMIDPDWAGSIFAVVVTFVILYFAIRIVAGMISKATQTNPALGTIDRLFGLVIGAARALVLIGAVHLMIAAALPGERTPRWLSEATLQPVSAAAAGVIQAVLPGIGRGADALSPVIDNSVRRGFSDDQPLQSEPGPNTSPPEPAASQ